MVTVGEQAPQFTAPKAGGAAYDDIEPLSLAEALENGPVVLAFYRESKASASGLDPEAVHRWVRDGENPDFETLVADVRAAIDAET